MTTNCTTHTATVHAGRVHADGRIVPACFSNSRVADLHYAAPTDREITCKNCLAGIAAREEAAAKPAAPTAYAKASAEAAKPRGEKTSKVVAEGPNGIVTRVQEAGEAPVWTVARAGQPVHFVALSRKEGLQAAGL